MHRTVELAVPADISDALVNDLKSLDGVVGLARSEGASIMPEGDVITVHALNRDIDQVMRVTKRVCGDRPFTVVTAEYHTPSLSGVIGVIGPTRMPYEKVISLVNHTSSLLSELLD